MRNFTSKGWVSSEDLKSSKFKGFYEVPVELPRYLYKECGVSELKGMVEDYESGLYPGNIHCPIETQKLIVPIGLIVQMLKLLMDQLFPGTIEGWESEEVLAKRVKDNFALMNHTHDLKVSLKFLRDVLLIVNGNLDELEDFLNDNPYEDDDLAELGMSN